MISSKLYFKVHCDLLNQLRERAVYARKQYDKKYTEILNEAVGNGIIEVLKLDLEKLDLYIKNEE